VVACFIKTSVGFFSKSQLTKGFWENTALAPPAILRMTQLGDSGAFGGGELTFWMLAVVSAFNTTSIMPDS
jgi:hypothetical protein